MDEEMNRPDDEKVSAAARLFDVRRVIGGLFVVYGLIVTLVGVFDGSAEIAKAQGVRINLWMGLAMLALGAFFLIWLRLRPAGVPEQHRSSAAEAGPEASAGD
ncbi:hypothetical protein ACFQFC_33555 [Amorphoplanes digitatis]|uniref:Putative membrane protein n=1 Tax=Actinoplanes digitatis TaxID=1868 RepID=A0A7W7HUL3_9ACTN|nr:hypothetical protein [Actinoplanes digitatis]MBB4761086.1 putative membrane protein [Actinoplanes digitatis]GID92702.1 hypothetical protein Adi01nite_21140 [Actinoplanes digitatis]